MSSKIVSGDPDPVPVAAPAQASAAASNAASQDLNVEQVFAAIVQVHGDNARLIEQINSKADAAVQCFRYSAPFTVENEEGSVGFALAERPLRVKSATLIATWRPTVELIHLFDMFNMRIDYKCEAYDDMKRLNAQLLELAQRYHMIFDEGSAKGRAELGKVKRNFDAIHAALTEGLKLCSDQPSRYQEVAALLQHANALLKHCASH